MRMMPTEQAPKAVSASLLIPDCENCTPFYWRFMQCLKAKHQFVEYHRTGEMEYCPAYFGDWSVCLQAKLSSDDEKKARLMMTTTTFKQNLDQSNRRGPWEAKETPQW